VGAGAFPLNVPLNILNREAIFDGVGCWPDATDGERRGIVSTLVDADTRRGVEIWWGLMRLRDIDPPGLMPSIKLVLEECFLRAIMAASVLRWTSLAKSAASAGDFGVEGFRGSRVADNAERGPSVGILDEAGLRNDELAALGECSGTTVGGSDGTEGDSRDGDSLSSPSCKPNKTCARSRFRRAVGETFFSV